MSLMGIPFGFGLTQIPALTSDIFGDNQYGFAFGIVQIGSIIAALTTMPVMQSLQKKGVTIFMLIITIAQLSMSIIWFFYKKKPNTLSDPSTNSYLIE